MLLLLFNFNFETVPKLLLKYSFSVRLKSLNILLVLKYISLSCSFYPGVCKLLHSSLPTFFFFPNHSPTSAFHFHEDRKSSSRQQIGKWRGKGALAISWCTAVIRAQLVWFADWTFSWWTKCSFPEAMESHEEKPIIYTMENKPIVTCECRLSRLLLAD